MHSLLYMNLVGSFYKDNRYTENVTDRSEDPIIK